MGKALHIIAFDVPFPANYGGIIDVFYKIKALHSIGVKITLHCFYYNGNNPPNTKLNQYCDQIYYYKRGKHIGNTFTKLPFIVASRGKTKLLENLLKDNDPILFEGLHTCYYLDHPQLKTRLKLFRAHNIEHQYYKEMAIAEKSFIKRFYFNQEAKKLEKFEHILNHAQNILSTAKMDIVHFKKYASTIHIPPFYQIVENEIRYHETNEFCLFHGNLSVLENKDAALFIIHKIAPLTHYKITIAGKDPSAEIVEAAQKQENVTLMANISQNEMAELIQKAQVHLLFTLQQTGVKLKLLYALSSGKHIIINEKMDDSNLFSKMCAVENNPTDIVKRIDILMETPFTEDLYTERNSFFLHVFDMKKSAQKIVKLLDIQNQED